MKLADPVRADFARILDADASLDVIFSGTAGGPHPYLQQTAALEFALVLDGTVTLVLDTAEVDLSAGDVVVQRGSRHAWSNRGDRPATVALTAHAGAYGAGAR